MHALFFLDDSFDAAVCTVIFKHISKNNVFLFDADIKIRVLTANDTPLALECANKNTGDKVLWLKEKSPVHTAFAGNEDNIIKIDNETGNLEILKEKEEVYGNYTCKVANATIEYRVVREYSDITFLDL